MQAALIQFDSEVISLLRRIRAIVRDNTAFGGENHVRGQSGGARLICRQNSEGFPRPGSTEAARNGRGRGLAIERAKRAFGAKYANVSRIRDNSQSNRHNRLLKPVINIKYATSHGGHYSHGFIDSVTANSSRLKVITLTGTRLFWITMRY